ncbi:cytochrome c [Pelomonas cellulosilytica]|uniref:Cytochrome c n=1 Tax=Pelomonas cellulosilytica TaxID=2906762 RepID=A0ABS8XSX3_9BURK|nr:cytochrome c [Pelomonas sp. P8]MCE4553992.1 cytochrome c [Pelomonas sp. P8]
MSKNLLAALLLPLLVTTTVIAAEGLTADDMRDAEDTLHNLDSRISLQDRKALDDAKELARYFQQVEGHFSAKADATRGVEFSRKSQAHAKAIVDAVEAGNYDAAMDALGDLTRSCKTCHEVYKKPK